MKNGDIGEVHKNRLSSAFYIYNKRLLNRRTCRQIGLAHQRHLEQRPRQRRDKFVGSLLCVQAG